jgi:hypothetical protein
MPVTAVLSQPDSVAVHFPGVFQRAGHGHFVFHLLLLAGLVSSVLFLKTCADSLSFKFFIAGVVPAVFGGAGVEKAGVAVPQKVSHMVPTARRA